MKVLVFDAFTRENGGDAALLSTVLRQIDEAFPGADKAIAGFENPDQHPAFEGVRNLGSVRRWAGDEEIGRASRVGRKILALGLAFVWFRGGRRPYRWLERWLPDEVARELSALADADLAVALGGGYLNATRGLAGDLNVLFLLLPAMWADRLGTPVVFGPQSFGPFESRLQRGLVRHVLRRAARVLVREDISMDLLRRLGVDRGQLSRAVDSAFVPAQASERAWRQELGVGATAPLIGVTARQWLSPAAQERYEAALAETIDWLSHDLGYRVVLIPQVTATYRADDDRIVLRRIRERCVSQASVLSINETLSVGDLRALYAELSLVVGTRFHSVIFALAAMVPCVAIQYDHKTSGIMQDLGLERWVVMMQDATAAGLRALIGRCLDEREEYCAHLRGRLPDYQASATGVVQVLRACAPSCPVPSTG